ncbi:hypothetical protein HanRHA438_Chr14g0675081 [Helianthus annuus]|nr:hypothetical protein HanRHA438_Chr14g0675081 [Helianthus annuus]
MMVEEVARRSQVHIDWGVASTWSTRRILLGRGGKMDGLDWIGCWVRMGLGLNGFGSRWVKERRLGWVWVTMSSGQDGFGSRWVENKSIII